MKDTYLDYDALQLATDEAFIRWVRDGDADMERAWRDWLEQHPHKKEEVAEARSLVQGIRFEIPEPEIDTGKLWDRIDDSRQRPAVVRAINNRRRFLVRALSAAAAAAVLILFVWLGLDRPNRINTGFEQHLAFTLPDQSRVQLNADTRLTYDAAGRQIDLEGEAYFEVEKGDDFVVETDLGEVRVLGTRFNVFSRGDRFRVQCTEGRVQVTTPSDPEGVILTAGTACRLQEDGRLMAITLEGIDAEVDWLKDIYRFRNEPLRVVFEELERQFDVRIQADAAVLSRPHSGFFEGGDLDSALYQVCYPQNLRSTINNGAVIITEADTE